MSAAVHGVQGGVDLLFEPQRLLRGAAVAGGDAQVVQRVQGVGMPGAVRPLALLMDLLVDVAGGLVVARRGADHRDVVEDGEYVGMPGAEPPGQQRVDVAEQAQGDRVVAMHPVCRSEPGLHGQRDRVVVA